MDEGFGRNAQAKHPQRGGGPVHVAGLKFPAAEEYSDERRANNINRYGSQKAPEKNQKR